MQTHIIVDTKWRGSQRGILAYAGARTGDGETEEARLASPLPCAGGEALPEEVDHAVDEEQRLVPHRRLLLAGLEHREHRPQQLHEHPARSQDCTGGADNGQSPNATNRQCCISGGSNRQIRGLHQGTG